MLSHTSLCNTNTAQIRISKGIKEFHKGISDDGFACIIFIQQVPFVLVTRRKSTLYIFDKVRMTFDIYKEERKGIDLSMI